MRILTLAAVLVVTVAAVMAWPRVAHAHALLLRSDPPQGARLLDAPAQVAAWFSEPLEPGASRLRVLGAAGSQVDSGEVQVDPADETKMWVGLDGSVGPGFYVVTWETLSRVDGHLRFGSFEFTVLNPDGSEPSGPRPEAAFGLTGTPTGISEGAATKAVGLIGAAILVGGLASLLFVILPASAVVADGTARQVRDASRRFVFLVLLPSVLVLLLAGVTELWLQARQLGGLHELDRVLETEWGERWLWRHYLLASVAAFLVLHLAIPPRGATGARLSLWGAWGSSLAYLLFLSLVSHANAVPQGSFWAAASDFVHLSAAAIWIGGLVATSALLIWSTRMLPSEERTPLLAAAISRLSLVATTSVVLLMATGLFNALAEVSTWSSLVNTAYGRTLTAKLTLLVPLLAVAGTNAFLLRPRLVREAVADGAKVERLRRVLTRTVPIEAAVAFVVLVVAAVLTQYTPARIGVEAAATVAPEAAARGDALGFPLTVLSWPWVVAGALAVAGVLLWLWAGYLGPALRLVRTAGRTAAVGLAILAGVVVLGEVATSGGPPNFDTAVAYRYQATDGRLALLEISPYQVGVNRFRVTVLTEDGQPAEARSVKLSFSRLEQGDAVREAALAPQGDHHLGEFRLGDSGWWAIEAVLDDAASATFYLRLDQPSRAPLEFAAPDYQSDPAAEQLFREALKGYEALQTVKWREELTSGLLDPTGIGAWVISTGQAEAPDKISYHTVSPGASNSQLVRVGAQSCFQDKGAQWQCSQSSATESFDLDYMDPSTAFQLGREEAVDGEMTQVVLFHNPSQPAWYAWWIGEDTGLLRRQAMVAPGHFMLTSYSGQNEPVAIQLPDEAAGTGG
ncbi:MAG: CopD family protein [Dehalococcoidia bacterium]|nr:CopD family protein [Dehalococcoidia bacterium]